MRKSSKFHALRQAQSSILERLSLGNRATYFTFFGSYDSDRRSVRVRSVRVWPMSEVGSNSEVGKRNREVRGRDASYLAPPAQIRTGPIRAYGSRLGCRTAKRLSGHG